MVVRPGALIWLLVGKKQSLLGYMYFNFVKELEVHSYADII